MKTSKNNIINWISAGLVGIIFIGSAMSKFLAGEETIQMAQSFGISIETFKILGIIELVSVILFIIPRTGILGTLLLAAYMGGAMATHLTHGQSILAPMIIEAIIWIAAVIRFPELKSRLLNSEK